MPESASHPGRPSGVASHPSARAVGPDAVACERVVAAMRDPAFYPHGPAEVELRETHISWVLLAGERVYKVKKPLHLPFLDYSSLARRRHLCQEEVRLNRRLAGDAYLGIVSIVEDGGVLRLAREDRDDAREYAVEMRRLPEERTLDRLLERGEADASTVAAVAERLASFHRGTERAEQDRGRPAAIRRTLDETFETLVDLAPEVSAAQVTALARFADAFLAGRHAELVARAESGCIREGHGDLRAEHIVVEDDVRAFDCVEFDAALRQIDVAADLAFLVMDLEARGRGDLARELLRAYRAAGGDAGDDGLVAFYAAYRAAVRAKVACGWAVRLQGDQARREGVLAEGLELLLLARRLAWHARRPPVLVLCGVAASGKTHLARLLAVAGDLAHVTSDVARKRLAGLDPTERGGAALYTEAATRRTYAKLAADAREALHVHGAVVVDATFRRARDRRVLVEALSGYEPVFLECRAPAELVRRRARERVGETDLVSDATVEIAERQLLEFEPLDEVPASEHHVIRTDRSDEELLAGVEALLDERLRGGLEGPVPGRP